MNYNPVYAFIKTLIGITTFKIRFKADDVGKTILMSDGNRFTVFRHVVKESQIEKGEKPAVFFVKFHLREMSPERNIKFSLIPMFFILGLPGFREKYWMINKQNGDFQGIYEWESEVAARNYANSFAMKFMTRRSVPGSIYHEIIPGTGIDDYLKNLNP